MTGEGGDAAEDWGCDGDGGECLVRWGVVWRPDAGDLEGYDVGVPYCFGFGEFDGWVEGAKFGRKTGSVYEEVVSAVHVDVCDGAAIWKVVGDVGVWCHGFAQEFLHFCYFCVF